MNGDLILLLPMILPLVMGVIIGFVKGENQRNALVFLTIGAEGIIVFLLAGGTYSLEVYQITDRLSILYQVDGFGKLFACMICVIWFLVGIFSVNYMKHEQKPARYFMFYILALGALISLCFAGNMMTLYLSYEYMTLLTLPLVIHTGTADAVRAGVKYLGYSVFGAGLGLMGFFFLNAYCDSTVFTAGGTLSLVLAEGKENIILIVYFLMMIGFGCKCGMFPLHAWLTTAHPVAPSPASAVLSGIITKGGVIAIVRVTYYLVGADFLRGTWVQIALLVLAIITVFMGSMLAYKEKGLKKRLAYSTISQVAYVLFGLFLLSPIGFWGAVLQVIFHVVAKNILFLCAGAIIYKTGKTLVSELKGIGKEMPIVMWCFTAASLSLIGIPPACGFISKWFLAEAALMPGFGILGIVGVAVLMISALLTAGYLLPIISDAFFPGDDYDYGNLKKKEPGRMMTLPLLILSASVIIFGIFPNLVSSVVDSITSVIF